MGFVKKATCILALSFWLMLASSTAQAFADNTIHITGITSLAAHSPETIHVYGEDATPGAQVTAMLSGPINQTVFIDNETNCWISLFQENMTLASTFAEDTGDWSINFSTPVVFPGDYFLYILDNASMLSDKIKFTIITNVTIMQLSQLTYFNATQWPFINATEPILFIVWMGITPSSGPPGTLVTISGQFPSSGLVEVYFDNTLVTTVKGNPTGAWNASFIIPNASEGNHTIRALNVNERWMSVATFTVTPVWVGFPTTPSFLLFSFSLLALAVVSALAFLMFTVISFKRRRKDKTTF